MNFPNKAETRRRASIKREQTLRKQLVEFIRNHPGCFGIHVPKPLRYLLIILNSEGILKYEEGWYIK